MHTQVKMAARMATPILRFTGDLLAQNCHTAEVVAGS